MCTLHDCQPYLQHLGVNQTRLVVIESLEGEGEGEGGGERRESGEEAGSLRKKGWGVGEREVKEEKEEKDGKRTGGVLREDVALTDISCPLSCAVSP